jgi:hypothetical protein
MSRTPIEFVNDDGGRAAAGLALEAGGFKGKAGDCVARAVAIATGRPYAAVYSELAEINALMPLSKCRRNSGAVGSVTARRGIYVRAKLFKDYMAALGFVWTPTMMIGSGCKVHVRSDELPSGRLVLNLSKHCAAVIDSVLHDTHPCDRNGTRCVYGYWRLGGIS